MLLLESALYLKIGMRLKSAAQGRGKNSNYKNKSQDVLSLCGEVFELEKLRQEVTHSYCDTECIEKKGKDVLSRVKKYLGKVEGQLFDHACEFKVGSNSKTRGSLEDYMKSLSSRIWDKSKNESLTGEKIDRQLVSYMLCRACVSAKHAMDIIDSEQWKKRDYDVPTMRRIVDVIFRCEMTDCPASERPGRRCDDMSLTQCAPTVSREKCQAVM